MEKIEGIKIIQHNASGINTIDDPSYPFRLDVTLYPPEFLQFAFIGMLGGREELIVRSLTREALEKFVQLNNLNTHHRLRTLTISEESY